MTDADPTSAELERQAEAARGVGGPLDPARGLLDDPQGD